MLLLLLAPVFAHGPVEYADLIHQVVPTGPLIHWQRPGYRDSLDERTMLDVYELPVTIRLEPDGAEWNGRLEFQREQDRDWLSERGDEPFCLVRWAVNVNWRDDARWQYDVSTRTPIFYLRDLVPCSEPGEPHRGVE